MVDLGRVSMCGCISCYDESLKKPKATLPQKVIVFRQIKIEGFVVFRWEKRFYEAFNQNLTWIKEGKLKYKETVTEGFEMTFRAFRNMLKGKNIGKAIVKV